MVAFLDTLVLMALGLFVISLGGFAMFRTGNRIAGSVMIIIGVGVFAIPAFL